MLNIADTLGNWCREGRNFVVATVVGVSGSAPLPPGTSLAVDADGHAVGSVSGGCVEAAVYQTCTELLARGGPAIRTRFGYTDSDAFAVGLTCGGEIDILMHRIDPAVRPHLLAATQDWQAERPTAVVQIADGPTELLGRTLYVPDHADHPRALLNGEALSDSGTDRALLAHARARLRAGGSGRIELGGPGKDCAEPLTALVHHRPSRPRMLIFGAVEFAAALSEVARFLGYRVTVCDARETFCTPDRFPHADEMVLDWPHRYLSSTELDTRTVICVLTHDPKFDIPLLAAALRLPVAYVGAMGSRRTHQNRLTSLREAGLSPVELARLHSPIGLDLGAGTPVETAISIAAEIIATANHGTGRPLTHTTGSIHRTAVTSAQRSETGTDGR
ncbi:XdhC family protein [Nocardia fusca]|uniref:XdhC family protein n=1 Tax=Nocardia fusca TaxID=941183 RepID=UPI0037979442